MQQGEIVRAVVTAVADYGISVEREGVPGFIQITELAWHPPGVRPQQIAHVGDAISVYVLAVSDERFSASIKRAHPELNPWRDAATRWRVGTVHVGTVTHALDWGVWVELAPGVVGVVLRDGVDRAVGVGDGVRVQVTALDAGELPAIELRWAE